MNKTLLFSALMFAGVAISFVSGLESEPGAALAGAFALFLGVRVRWMEGDQSTIDSTAEGERFVPAYLVPVALPIVFFVTGWLLKTISN